MIYMSVFAPVLCYEYVRRNLIQRTNSNVENLKAQLAIKEKSTKVAQEILMNAPEDQKNGMLQSYNDLILRFDHIHYGFNKEISTDEAKKILNKLEPRLKSYKSLPKLFPF